MKGYHRITFDNQMYCGFDEDFMQYRKEVDGMSALPTECLWPLYLAAKFCVGKSGIFVECGVDRGGSARFIRRTINGSGKELHLFDTFAGMPKTRPEIDSHVEGDFPPVSIDSVKEFVGEAIFHKGLIPTTFTQIEAEYIAFAHIDLDIYESTKAACEFIYPRLTGIMVLDDYGRHTTKGVRLAVDDYFNDKDCFMLPNILNGQMVVVKV